MSEVELKRALYKALEVSHAAHATYHRAKHEVRMAERALGRRNAEAIIADNAHLPVRAFAELVADAARTHGGTAAITHEVSEDTWTVFRKLLAELVRRAETEAAQRGEGT